MLPRRVRANSVMPHLGAIGAYLLLSLVVTYPLVTRLSTEALGEDYPDRVQNLWNLWWVKVALVDLHTNPFHTGLLFYPDGANLYFHTLNLPLALVVLLPQVLCGLVVAYNCALLIALLLAGYAGWRLVYYLTGHWAAALCAGVIIGFNSLGLISTRSQVNLVNCGPFVLCIEFYLRAWERGRPRDGILAGLCFTLALLTVGYYEVYLLVFFVVHLGWMLLAGRAQPWRVRLAALARRARPVLGWGGGTAVLLAGPYVLAALADVLGGRLAPQSSLDAFRGVLNSADLLSFVLPYRAGALLGQGAPWWAVLNPAIHDHTYLGLVGAGLAGLGCWVGRRQVETWLWVAVGAVGAVLALGPVLQVGGHATVRLPFALLQDVPPFSLVRFPERFVFLTYVALGVLAAGGVVWIFDFRFSILDWYPTRTKIPNPKLVLSAPNGSKIPNPKSQIALILALLVLDMPLYPRTTTPLVFPSAVTALAPAGGSDSGRLPGPILELPFTKHDWPDAIRMYYQIDHGRPTTSGYLSRTIPDPYGGACAPFHAFVRYRPAEAHDVVTPNVDPQLPALIAREGIAFLVVYKTRPVTSQRMDPLPAWELADLQGVAARAGTVMADDATATVYRVRSAAAPPGPYLQLGPGWYDLEASNGAPFRWMAAAQADLCVAGAAARTAPLTFQVISFGAPRHLQVWVGDRQVFAALVPAGWAPQTLTTPPLAWPAGPQLVRLVSPDAPLSPAGLGQGADTRPLGLGFSDIRLGP